MNRRQFIAKIKTLLGSGIAASILGTGNDNAGRSEVADESKPAVSGPGNGPQNDPVTLFLSGDVMTGRGIDQVLPHSVEPTLHERYVKDARRYVEIAERHSGDIPDDVSYKYIWGDALDELARISPHARIINLETSITDGGDPWAGKGIHYRMHPENAALLKVAGIDCSVLGNNHILDWGYKGLCDTLATLEEADIAAAGAGVNSQEAERPAVVETGNGRLLVFSFGSHSSGIPKKWQAGGRRPGVNYLPSLGSRNAKQVIRQVESVRREGDRVIVSIHWGGNWGYKIPERQRDFARRLIDNGAADLVHGHSSHHPKGIEVYEGRLILYGCGDLINDYEGISGHEQYRGDLSLMYFPTLQPDGRLSSLEMSPMQIHRFRLNRPSDGDVDWISGTLQETCEPLGTGIERIGKQGQQLRLLW